MIHCDCQRTREGSKYLREKRIVRCDALHAKGSVSEDINIPLPRTYSQFNRSEEGKSEETPAPLDMK